MKFNINNIGGAIAKQDERYIVRDNKFGNNLILSSTSLNPNKSTTGHSHEGQEEVYFFVSGKGTMQLEDELFTVQQGDIITIKGGEFHRVFNNTDEELYFVCVFNGNRQL